MRRLGALLLAAALAGCGGYPEPFQGNPGRNAMRLSVPPPPRLVVVAPAAALLRDKDAELFARDMADALVARAVPAVTGSDGPDWRLTMAAEMQGAKVVPSYTVLNPKGVKQGTTAGGGIAAGLWAQADPVAFEQVAARDAPEIAAMLERINAAVQDSDPNSLENRPARLAMQGVSGAPGDGDAALGAQMVQQLTALGIVVQNTTKGADYALSGAVRVAPSGMAGQSRVEIQWTVRDPYGKEAGHLLQMNDIPQGSLDRYWGDVAMVVAQEAAGGVREVIINQTAGKRLAPAHGAGAAASPPPQASALSAPPLRLPPAGAGLALPPPER